MDAVSQQPFNVKFISYLLLSDNLLKFVVHCIIESTLSVLVQMHLTNFFQNVKTNHWSQTYVLLHQLTSRLLCVSFFSLFQYSIPWSFELLNKVHCLVRSRYYQQHLSQWLSSWTDAVHLLYRKRYNINIRAFKIIVRSPNYFLFGSRCFLVNSNYCSDCWLPSEGWQHHLEKCQKLLHYSCFHLVCRLAHHYSW